MLLSSSFSYLPNIASNILVSHRDVSTSPSTYISAHILSGWSHFQNWLQNTHKMHTAPWGLVMPNTMHGNTSLQPQECKPGAHSHVKHTWESSRTGSLFSAAPAQMNFNYSCILALLSIAQVALHLEKHHRGGPAFEDLIWLCFIQSPKSTFQRVTAALSAVSVHSRDLANGVWWNGTAHYIGDRL